MSNSNKYQYVIDAMNDFTRLLNGSPDVDQSLLQKAMANAERSLDMLLNDPAFKQDLYKVTAAFPGASQDFDEMRRDLWLFLDQFIKHDEEKALRQAGLDTEAISQLLVSAAGFHNALGNPPKPDVILIEMQRLRDGLKQGSTEITGLQHRSKSRKLFTKWAYRFGGAVLIVVDATSALPTAATSIASVAAGTAVMAWND